MNISDSDTISESNTAIKQAVYEAQFLVAYLARISPINVDSELINILIESKYLLEQGKWNCQAEIAFWQAYDNIATLIEPVTIESLKATMPDPFAKKREFTLAWWAVMRYGIITALSLIILLFAQSYWIVGSDLSGKLGVLFHQIDEISFNIDKRKILKAESAKQLVIDIELNQLNSKKKALIQEFGASYQLLQDWNRTWQVMVFKEQYCAAVTDLIERKYQEDIKESEQQISEIEDTLKSSSIRPEIRTETEQRLEKLRHDKKRRRFEHEFDKERNKLFLTRISADFVLRSLQVYGLPLLYGLLGSLIFTLRSLAAEIKNITYTYHSEIRYRLRISLGLLGGMVIGWFLKPEDISVAGSLSPMALAFLMGYNVEVLFTLMDKLIQTILKFNPGSQQTPAQVKS